jgi:hypothetical protein
MKRLGIIAAMAIAFSGLAIPSAPIASAHGACSVTSIITVHVQDIPRTLELDGSTFCSDVHVSTWIQIFLHQNSRTGAVVYIDSANCTDCRAVAIERFVTFPCNNGQRYVLEAFGWQRMDHHNQTGPVFSKRVTCPFDA